MSKPSWRDLYPEALSEEDYHMLCLIAEKVLLEQPTFRINLPHGIYLTNESLVEVLDSSSKEESK